MKKTLIRLLSLVLIVVMTLGCFTGCGGDNNDSDKAQVKTNEKGMYDISKLSPVKAAEMKMVNGRPVIYHNGEPYHYYSMHLRWDHILSAYSEEDYRMKLYEEGFKIIKESGFETVILYLSWSRIFDGEKYDFSELEMHYELAKKYDLKVHLNWFGYNVCGFGGFMPWQTDREKYPALSGMDGAPLVTEGGYNVPDFSQQIYIDEVTEALQQVCAWLNVNDTDRRTVAIQLENEPGNEEGGRGLWMSQFLNFAALLDAEGKAIKEGPYSMITYLNLMSAGYSKTADGYDFNGRLKYLTTLEYVDIVGYDDYTTNPNPNLKNLEYNDNLATYAEYSPASYSVPGQVNQIFSKGYGLSFYQVANFRDLGAPGFYRYNNPITGIEKRDGTKKLNPNTISPTLSEALELDVDELVNMNKAIKALRELIITEKISNILAFNNTLKNEVDAMKLCNKQRIKYHYKDTSKQYGGSGLVIGAKDGNFYLYSSRSASYEFASEIAEVTTGSYKDGKWTETGKVTVNGKTFKVEPGLAYRVVLK